MSWKKRKIVFFTIIISMLSIFSNASAGPDLLEKHMAKELKIDKKVQQLIDNYVIREKGWDKDSYCVKFNRREDGAKVFLIIHQEDEISIIPGGGKSFEIHIDEINMEIVRVLLFQ